MGFLANFFVLGQCLRSQLSQCPLKPFWSDSQKKGIRWSGLSTSCILSDSHCMFSDSRRLFRYMERDDTHTALVYSYIVKPSANPTKRWNNIILQLFNTLPCSQPHLYSCHLSSLLSCTSKTWLYTTWDGTALQFTEKGHSKGRRGNALGTTSLISFGHWRWIFGIAFAGWISERQVATDSFHYLFCWAHLDLLH